MRYGTCTGKAINLHMLERSAHTRAACRYDLHVLLVEHGKRCPRCAKIPGRKEPVGECPLARKQAMPCDMEASAAASTAKPAHRRKRKTA